MRILSVSKGGRHPQNRSGVALIIVVAFLVLLTALVVALLTSALSALEQERGVTERMKVNTAARGVIDLIVADLRGEIRANSIEDNTGEITLYLPEEDQQGRYPSMVPSLRRNDGTTEIDPNDDYASLIKQSGSTLFDSSTVEPLIPEGSAIPTDVPSKNGRIVSPRRWAKPLLIKNVDSSSAFLEENTLPKWVYMTDQGLHDSGALSRNERIVSRFAFNIYNTGGLLDANVAGFDENQFGSEAPYKGSQLWADLTAINDGQAFPAVDRFVGWRDKATLGESSDEEEFLRLIREEIGPKGFLFPYRVAGFGSDRFFGSRQDLIGFQRSYPEIVSEGALPFLTHWSRDLNTPTYSPPDPNLYPERPGGDRSDLRNAPLEELDPSPMRLTREVVNADGKTESIPLMSSRFPLDRLRYVDTPDSISDNPIDSEAAEKFFGLDWNASNFRWQYTETKSNRIKTLQEVLDDDSSERDPNFFEVLKAAIQVGSLGAWYEYGLSEGSTDIADSGTGLRTDRDIKDRWIDEHIIRIGACIIDQYDEDNFPTRIVFNGNEIYGQEDLPMIYMARRALYQVTQFGTDWTWENPQMVSDAPQPGDPSTNPWLIADLIQPILWNPHEETEGSFTSIPEALRVTAESISNAPHAALRVRSGWDVGSGGTGWTSDFSNWGGPEMPDVSGYIEGSETITVDYNASASNGLFREPRILRMENESESGSPVAVPQARYQGGQNILEAGAFPAAGILAPPSGYSGDVFNGSYRSYEGEGGDRSEAYQDFPGDLGSVVGFFLGYSIQGPSIFGQDDGGILNRNTNQRNYFRRYQTRKNNLSLFLQFEVDGRYFTYDKMNQTFTNGATGDIVKTLHHGGMTYKADPRTDRFGSFYNTNQYGSRNVAAKTLLVPIGTTIAPTALDWSVKSSRPRGGRIGTNWVRSNSQAFVHLLQANNPNLQNRGASFYYEDADGIVRGSDGRYVTLDIKDESPKFWPMSIPEPRQDVGRPEYVRPVILNRPFRSVGEMGYAFRDLAWKTINFASPDSADGALLEYFCLFDRERPIEDEEERERVRDEVEFVAGKVNINTPHKEVIKALLVGAAKKAAGLPDIDPTDPNSDYYFFSPSDVDQLAEEIVNFTSSNSSLLAETGQGPLRYLSDIIGRPATNSTALEDEGDFVGLTSLINEVYTGELDPDRLVDSNREAIARSLVDSVSTRTWTFLIDLVVQTGSLPPSAQNDFADFRVAGESRYWVHLSMDRFTAQIIDIAVEQVVE